MHVTCAGVPASQQAVLPSAGDADRPSRQSVRQSGAHGSTGGLHSLLLGGWNGTTAQSPCPHSNSTPSANKCEVEGTHTPYEAGHGEVSPETERVFS